MRDEHSSVYYDAACLTQLLPCPSIYLESLMFKLYTVTCPTNYTMHSFDLSEPPTPQVVLLPEVWSFASDFDAFVAAVVTRDLTRL